MEYLEQLFLLSTILKFVTIAVIFIVASILHRFSWRIAGLLLRISPFKSTRLHINESATAKTRQINWLPKELITTPQLRQEHRRTLQDLLASATSFVIFTTAIVLSLNQFIEADTLVWVLGFFTAAIAFAARTFVGDLVSGLTILFQDKLMVGEKIRLHSQFEAIEGVVERVNLKATKLRSRTGELYIINNGELRFVCNYSRGPYSSTTITVKISAEHLTSALKLLKELSQAAVDQFPALKEPWLVLNESGTLGKSTQLTLALKAEFGHAAELRPQLMSFIQYHLREADIPLAE